ncbi:hypothetical protein KFE25_008329 [Diacronema lutheri]|uniref:Uncharacterized protein n=1 Tax=Diacronema lutheri TaxID=2081491 RepID=A0A8J5XS75_DIALT|nr:hypothetical protein KFE25_008329 [Diacronema lutheri]
MAARRLVGRVSAVYGTSKSASKAVLVDVLGIRPKFPQWITRMRADLPPAGLTTALNDNVEIEQRGEDSWAVVRTGLEPPEGMPPLPVHPVNTTLTRALKGEGQKEVNNVGRYYAAKWEAGKAARERTSR